MEQNNLSRIFPINIYQQLDGIDFRLLGELAFLSKQQKKRTGSAYCCPSRTYLAKRVGCDVGTISRHTTKLEGLDILEKQQRRPVRGIWQTCFYKLKGWSAWTLAGIANKFRKKFKQIHRVRPNAHIASVRTDKITPEAKSTAKREDTGTIQPLVASILDRWRSRGKGKEP